MNLIETLWVIANGTALLYSLYLGKKGYSYLTNVGQLIDKLQERAPAVKTEKEAEHLQNMYRAANRVGAVGLMYLGLFLVGMLGLLILNTILLSS